MKRILTAALAYFAAVFGAGFVLGTLRVLWIAPALGARLAELLELPVMLAVVVLAARWIVRRCALRAHAAPRLAMGLVALALMLAAEFTVGRWLRGVTLAAYVANLDPLTDAAYYGALVLFAAMPLFVPAAIAQRSRAAWACALAVPVAMAAVVYARYASDLRTERERVASGSTVAQTACGPIEYTSFGEGPAVLLVHGAGGGYDQMLDMARELADAGLRIVAPSCFGYLRTPLPADASPAAQADAHACLLDALQIERAAVIGISAGGPSSMQFALRHPARTSRLVLLVPLAYAPRPQPRALAAPARFMLERALESDFLYWAAMTFDPDLVLRTVLGTPPELVATADLEERVRVTLVMRHILPVSRRQHGLLNEATIAASLERYDLERIAVPTLLVSTEDDGYDTYVGARYTAEHVPGARFIGYRSGGHLLVGHQAEVTHEITTFLGAAPRIGMQ